MTESHARALHRVGGSPAFVAGHGLSSNEDLPFEEAYALAKVVLENGGGPVTFTGRKATISKPTVTALTHRGLLEVIGSSGTPAIDKEPNSLALGLALF